MSEKKNTRNTSKAKKTTKKKSKLGKVLTGIFYTILLFIFIGVISVCFAGAAFFIYIASNAPEFDENKLYRSEPSTIYDKDGKVIAEIGTEDRVILGYEEIPEVLVNAIVATEDARFFNHNGIDLPRFLVASVYQVLGRDAGGASTLTMQISKNNYTSKEAKGLDGIIRKFTDVYMAVFKIEPAYSKEEIFEFYANSFDLGGGFGVEATAKNYFGKSAKDLNLAEAALIAGLYQAPGSYNPRIHPEAAEKRRINVLKLMKRHGYITDSEYEIAAAMTVDKLLSESSRDIGSGLVDKNYQYFVDMVIEDVIAKTGNSPYTTSMHIYTTMDAKKQKDVSNIMNGKSFKWQNKKVQAGVAVVDVETGAIVAIGGGRNVSAANTLNRAIDIKRQIGSTAKPLYDYGPAIEYLNWNTGTIINDSKTTYSDGTSISNWDGGYRGYNTIAYHLKESRNIPALKTFKAVSKSDIIKFTTSLGLTPEIYSCNAGYRLSGKKCINKENPNVVVDAKQSSTIHEAHAIGGYNGENPLSVANAYAAFANGGYYNEPYSFSKIIYDNGEVYINHTQTTQVMSDSTAYMITNMLQDVSASMGGYRSINGVKYAAKSGTSNFDDKTKKANKLPYNAINDLWVAGYNTEYSIAVWYGYDSIKIGYSSFGCSQHQKLFQALGKKIFTNKSNFKKPSSVVKVTTEANTATALLPGPNTPSSKKVTSLFISGTEPNKVSTKYDKLADVTNLSVVNNDNGTATLSWNKIATPDALTKSYLTGLATKSIAGNEASKYASHLLSNNKKELGDLGYNIYVNNNGTLELKGWTSNSSYTVELPNGNYNLVVKSAYKKYKSNMSNGNTVNVTITGSYIVNPEPIY